MMKRAHLLLILTTALLLETCGSALSEEKAAKVVMFGDSTTLCSRSKKGHKLTDYVQADLAKTKGTPASVINAGKNRDTIKEAYKRLMQDVLLLDPDLVTISFGLNDVGRSTSEDFREYLEKTVQAIQKETQAQILLVTSTPFNNELHAWGPRFAAEGGLDEYLDDTICSEMREVAEKFQLPLCDLHKHFISEFEEDPILIEVLLRPDGVHPSSQGNKMAAKYLAPVIRSLINKRSTTAKTSE